MLLVELQHRYGTVLVHHVHADFRLFPVYEVDVGGQLPDLVSLYRLDLVDRVVPDLRLGQPLFVCGEGKLVDVHPLFCDR